jgi:hypothetical protein
MFGGGEGGHLSINASLRYIKWFGEFYTSDDFVTTSPYPTPYTGPFYRIKYLSNDSMVLCFRVVGSSTPPATYYWWHDVYVK